MQGQIYLGDYPEKPKLTMQETYQYINEYQKNHDPLIKERLVIDNIKLVMSMTKRFYQKSQHVEDLFQVGIIGLIKAIENFNTDYQLQFSTYAVPLIIGEMKRFLRDNSSLRISRTLKDHAYAILKLKDEYLKTYQREPTIEEIQNILHLSIQDIQDALLSTHSLVSLEEPVGQEDNDLALMDVLTKEDNYLQVLNDHVDLMNALSKLSGKQQKIIYQRYFEGLSQSEIAGELYISQAQVSRIEKKAISSLHKMLE